MHIKKRHIPEALEEAALLFQQGILQQAGVVLTTILKADPRQAEALHLLGLLAGRSGNLTEAHEHLQRAAKIDPNIAEYHNSLGVVLRKLDRLSDAERSYQRCLKLEPDHVEALDNLGNLLRLRKRPGEAEKHCRRAIRLRPNDFRLLINLAGALYEQGSVIEASKLFERSLGATPSGRDRHVALSGLIECFHAVGDSEKCCELSRKMLAETGAAADLSAFLMRLNYLTSISAQELALEHRQQMLERYPADTPKSNDFKDRMMAGRSPLRIGYLSPDLVDHPVGWLLEPVVSNHDRKQVTTVLYDVHKGDYKPKEGLCAACDIWRGCRNMPDEQLARLIREDNIDIIVDLAGHTGGNRLALLAKRVAPLQVSWLGYFNTTGLLTMDWLLADPYSIHPGEEFYYTERIWRLPNYRFAIQPKLVAKDALRTTKQNSEDRIVFVSCNNLLKITSQVLQAWAAILQQLPDAILLVRWKTLVSDEIRTAFSERFVSVGGTLRQLRLLPPLEHDQLLASYHQADIMLDSFPFSGGMTSIDALSMGVPVVTLAGDRMAGRQTQAFLELSGHPELVAHSVDEYVKIAVDLASDPQRLRQLQEALHDNLMRSPLCDVKQFTRDLEAAYRAIWEDRCCECIAR